jgi:hypothetical protein
VSDIAPFNPGLLLTALDKHRVQFVMIGALAARLHGLPRLTADVDITPATSRKNLEHLAAALRELNAKVYTQTIPEGLAFDCSAPTLIRAVIWNLVSDAGRVDLCIEPAGTTGYDDLARDAVKFEAFGVQFLVASLDDIIRMKKAADRTKDREDVLLLKELRRRTRK